ncbi:hypothetical protein VNO80_23882 [Phaseolus coccineus]|uniref:Uncharacterized protein n=1 Tax=Phaseolus coccineus TaxID=3886 RepID=A0AAN9MBS2_PHACN
MEVDRKERMWLCQEKNANFQASIILGGMESTRKDSKRRECVLTSDTTLESWKGLEKARFSFGMWSLMMERSKRDLNATSYMFWMWSKAAVGAVKPCNLGETG